MSVNPAVDPTCILLMFVRSLMCLCPLGDTSGLGLDAAANVYVWGQSYAFASTFGGSGGSGPAGDASYPYAVLISSITNLIVSEYGYQPLTPVPAGVSVVAVSAGTGCGCFLLSDATASCFGDVGSIHYFSSFVNGADGRLTDGNGNILTGIQAVRICSDGLQVW